MLNLMLGLFLAGCGGNRSPICASVPPETPELQSYRTIQFSYVTRVQIPEGDAPVDLFLPVPGNDPQQRIFDLVVDTAMPGEFGTEAAYNNRFWHGHLDASTGEPIEVTMTFTVEREEFAMTGFVGPKTSPITAADRTKWDRYLQSNALVPVGEDDTILAPVLQDVRKAAGKDATPSLKALAIYDYVVDNVEYKKVGEGWGNGDTYWACNARYGNCTDFHSLYLSLARTEGIPARFEMGFPLPEDRSEGKISGYHCWVQFWLPDVGWIPIDASEAAKHPDKRQLYFGTHPADRVRFTTGRDLQLGEGHADKALNYFVYPYLEVGGKAQTDGIETDFSYKG